MKKIILLFTISLISISAFSQDYSQLGDYKFKNIEDYKKSEKQVLECSNYLLNNPVGVNELNRLNALRYILNWMEGTPDYLFSIDDKAVKITKGRKELFSLYMSSMPKAILENEKLTDNEVYEKVVEYLIAYCSVPSNNLKPSKGLKKLMKKKGK